MNDDNKPNPILHQTMHYMICHFVCQNSSVDSVAKRKKGMISYNQQYKITSIKDHILGEHPIVWCRWENVNVTFNLEELHWEKSKKIPIISYGAIINHSGNGNPSRRMMHNNKSLWKTYFCLLPKLTCLFLLSKISG